MNILAGLRAIERTPRALSLPEKNKKKHATYKRLVRKMSDKEIAANALAQTSTVVKMCLDGFTILDITGATKVSGNHINDIKKRFGLLRKSHIENRQEIKSLILNSAPFTHSVKSISKELGLNNEVVRRTIRKIPQIERGTQAGQIHKLCYNTEIITGDGSTSRGIVY